MVGLEPSVGDRSAHPSSPRETKLNTTGNGSRSSRLPAVTGTALAVLAATTLASCYTYEPVDGPFPGQGVEVRAYLTADARRGLEDLLVPDRRWIEGRVARSGPDTLILTVDRRPEPGTPGGRVLRQDVSLSRAEIDLLEIRQMDRLRTGILGGTVAAAGVALLYRIIQGRGEDTRNPTPPSPPTDARIPRAVPPGAPR